MLDKIFNLVNIPSSFENKETIINPNFWIWVWVFLHLPSSTTLEKFLKENQNFQKSNTKILNYTKKIVGQIYCQASHEETKEYEEIFNHYKLEICFD